MIVKNVEQTCGACPSQWDFEVDNGRAGYARYRGGHLSIEVDGNTVYSQKIGDIFDGVISWEKVYEIIKDLDADAAIAKFQAAEEQFEKSYRSDPAVRREVWKKQIEVMNQYIIESRKISIQYNLSVSGDSATISPEKAEEMLAKWESEYADDEAKVNNIDI